MNNYVKVTGIKRTVGTYKGKEFDNVRVQYLRRITPDSPISAQYVDKVSGQSVGSGNMSGSWLDVQECKLHTVDALVIFECDTFEELVQICGKRFTLYFDRFGAIASAILTEEV